MPNISLDFRTRDYLTAHGAAVRSIRPFVTIQIGGLRPLCLLDTGAPFSVVSFAVAQQIQWKLLGNTLSFQGSQIPLEWHGIPCDFGETSIDLLDLTGSTRKAGCRIVGKFAKARHPTLENYVLLGMNFFADNAARLEIHGVPGSVSGVLSIP